MWIPVRVTHVMGPISYEVSTDKGFIWCYHMNQLADECYPMWKNSPRSVIEPEPKTSPQVEKNDQISPQC